MKIWVPGLLNAVEPPVRYLYNFLQYYHDYLFPIGQWELFFIQFAKRQAISLLLWGVILRWTSRGEKK